VWPIVGHEQAVDRLAGSVALGRVAHAYLFTGPRQIGKTTLALTFAQALNCREADRPCGRCLSCTKIAHGNHPDVRLLEGQSGTVKIDQIRSLQNDVALSAHEGAWKVYVLRNFEQATTEASNCLLKTLEEPPTQVVLLLTSSSHSLLLPTITSRCQLVALHPVGANVIREALIDRWHSEPARADLLARVSAGRPGWAVDALTDKAVLVQREQVLQDAWRVAVGNRVVRLRYAEELSAKKESIDTALDIWQSWWRDLLLARTGCGDLIANVDHREQLAAQAPSYDVEQIGDFLNTLLDTTLRLEQDVNARLALDLLFLKLPTPQISSLGGISL
jgi:DNA polymerase-3 subunit delta'